MMVNRIKVKPIGLAILAVFVLAACGQKHALYLPEEPATNTTPDTEQPTESAEQGKD